MTESNLSLWNAVEKTSALPDPDRLLILIQADENGRKFIAELAAGLSNADLALMICNSDGVADHSIIVIREARADETVAPDITYDVALEIVPICDRFADEGRQIQACAAGLLRQFKLRNAIEDRDTAKYLNQREYA